jgi:hypothetical protein
MLVEHATGNLETIRSFRTKPSFCTRTAMINYAVCVCVCRIVSARHDMSIAMSTQFLVGFSLLDFDVHTTNSSIG